MGKQRSVQWLVVLLLGFWLGGCSEPPAVPEPLEERPAALPETRAEVPGDGLYWWYVRLPVLKLRELREFQPNDAGMPCWPAQGNSRAGDRRDGSGRRHRLYIAWVSWH